MALMITSSNFYLITGFNTNVDFALITPAIQVAQDLNLMPAIGEQLYDKMLTDYTDNNLTGAYLTLYNNYIKNVIAWYAASHSVIQIGYKFAKGNIYRMNGGDDRSEVVTEEELQMIGRKFKTFGQEYLDRMSDYICANPNSYPEYYQYINGKVNTMNVEQKIMRGINLY